jgi:hypothetical protein
MPSIPLIQKMLQVSNLMHMLKEGLIVLSITVFGMSIKEL